MLNNKELTVFLAACAALACAQPLQAAWTGGGIPLCTAGGAQDTPAIVADGTGGAVIVWRDSRAVVNTDIYAQGVTADGAIRWYDTGMPVCVIGNTQSTPLAIADGSGGTIIAWQDSRTGGSVDIYAQKLASNGYIVWPTNGVAICTGQTGVILGGIVSDGAGGAIITWHDRRNFYNDIFAQRIASNGAVQWTANGVAVCVEATAHQQYPSLAPDGSGGAIIAWEDRRSGTYDIYAQRLSAGGVPQWTANGIVICDSGQNQNYPQAVEDGSGGAVIAWTDRRNTLDYDIFAQRVDASGALQWGFGTAVSATMRDQEGCRLVHIGSGETIVAWLDERNTTTSVDIYAQKLGAAGAAQWTANGVGVCAATGTQDNLRIAGNGAGGAFIAWSDARGGAANLDVYAQNVGSDGSPAWTADGNCICGSSGNQREAAIFADGSSGIFVAWTDGRSGTDKAYSHRTDAAGNIPTATLLYSCSAQLDGTSIRIDWTLSEIDEWVEFRILRAASPAAFAEIPPDGLVEDGLSFSFVDRGCEPGLTYRYRVAYLDGGRSVTLFETDPIEVPAAALVLGQNSPNPFNPRTVIGYYLPEPCRVRLEVFDAGGRRVAVLVDGTQAKGPHSVDWDGTGAGGAAAASGVYFYRLGAGKTTLSRKMILLR